MKTENEIERTLKWAARYGMSALQLGKALTAPPHGLTPADATQLMDRYRRDFPEVATVWSTKPLPKKASDEIRAVTAEPAAAPRLSIVNRSAVKAYALKVSKAKRAGKFTRVGESFLNAVEAELDSRIRAIGGPVDVQPDSEADWMINGRAVRLVEEKLNELTKRVVHGKVMRHPSSGVTLKD